MQLENIMAIPLQTNLYISKWGSGPLMEHAPNYCPYITTNMRYFQHRTSLPYNITSSIVGSTQITVNMTQNYSLPHYYHGMSITWSSEPFPGMTGSCQSFANSDGSFTFSADTPGAYYLRVNGYRNGEQLIEGYSTIIVNGT